MTKEEIQALARRGVLNVVFTKVDGTERQMRCTLMTEHLPDAPDKDNPSGRRENADVLSVWDLEKNDWRSFHVSSVRNLITE